MSKTDAKKYYDDDDDNAKDTTNQNSEKLAATDIINNNNNNTSNKQQEQVVVVIDLTKSTAKKKRKRTSPPRSDSNNNNNDNNNNNNNDISEQKHQAAVEVEIIDLLDDSDDSDSDDNNSKCNSNSNSNNNNNNNNNDSEHAKLPPPPACYRKRKRQREQNDTTHQAATIAQQQHRHQHPFGTSAASVATFDDTIATKLSHEQKQENFVAARRPEQLLREELEHLQKQLKQIPPSERESRRICNDEINKIQSAIKKARHNASEDIFHRNNSAGEMGTTMNGDGILTIDLHGQYVTEACTKFDVHVLPVLPVEKQIAVVVGRGIHSHMRKCKLKDGLIAHIENSIEFRDKQMKWDVDQRNEGRLLVQWIQ